MSDQYKSPSEESEDAEDLLWEQIIHNDCGMPIELCLCPDPPLEGEAPEGNEI